MLEKNDSDENVLRISALMHLSFGFGLKINGKLLWSSDPGMPLHKITSDIILQYPLFWPFLFTYIKVLFLNI